MTRQRGEQDGECMWGEMEDREGDRGVQNEVEGSQSMLRSSDRN